MDNFVLDSTSVSSSIKYHAELTPSFSPEKFELPKVFHATAESVQDMLIINWNAKYEYYEKMNVKQAFICLWNFFRVEHCLMQLGI